MGCGLNQSASGTLSPANMELSLAMNVRLDRWNSRQICLVRTRFKLGLSRPNQLALDLAGFCAVFPQLTRFPTVTPCCSPLVRPRQRLPSLR